jgi:hypothetical protein
MELCSKCQEEGKDTEAKYAVWAIAYFDPTLKKFVGCWNDGTKVCKPCLDFTLTIPTIKVQYQILEEVA